MRDVYFVGTIPLERTVDVFSTLADCVGPRARRIPDGEIGDRKLWVSSQYPILASCPAIERCEFPPGGLTRQTSYELPLRIRSGATDRDFTLSDLGYARHAIASYGLFASMQAAGKIPAEWRFQVNVPSPMDVMSMLEPASRARVEGPYEKVLLAELGRIQDAIPHERLAITFDIVRGVLFWEDPGNTYFPCWFADPLGGTVERLALLGKTVARDVELGYHLCYGSQDHKHAIEPRDLGACVRLSNAVASKLDRPIDYVHMPVPRERSDDAYFAPLATLSTSVKHIYLGLIHYTDGVEGAKRRIAAAEKYRADFGIATECGFGRRPSHQDVRRLVALHGEIAAQA